jgi:hypothetical protein
MRRRENERGGGRGHVVLVQLHQLAVTFIMRKNSLCPQPALLLRVAVKVRPIILQIHCEQQESQCAAIILRSKVAFVERHQHRIDLGEILQERRLPNGLRVRSRERVGEGGEGAMMGGNGGPAEEFIHSFGCHIERVSRGRGVGGSAGGGGLSEGREVRGGEGGGERNVFLVHSTPFLLLE